METDETHRTVDLTIGKTKTRQEGDGKIKDDREEIWEGVETGLPESKRLIEVGNSYNCPSRQRQRVI